MQASEIWSAKYAGRIAREQRIASTIHREKFNFSL